MKLNNPFVAGQMISKSEMLAAGLPIGNPYPMQAPFNRRYEMPFAPLVGAFTAIGAASGIVGTTLAVVNFAAVAAMYAGVAMTVTGLVTGDKELMKIGGLVGLAGGVGSLAIGGIASVAAGADLTLGTAGINAANAATTAAETASATTSGLTGTISNAITPELTSQATTQAANVGTSGLLGTTGSAAGNIGTSAGNFLNNTVGANLSNIASTGAGTGAGIAGTGAGTGTGAGGIVSGLGSTANQVAASAAVTPTANAGFFSDLMSQMTAKDWAMLGGSAVIGGAKSMAAHAQTAAQQEAADNLRAQRSKNLNTIPQLTTLGTLGAQPAGA